MNGNEKVPKGGTKAMGEGSRGRFFSGNTTCPHCSDPMGSPKGLFPPNEKTI